MQLLKCCAKKISQWRGDNRRQQEEKRKTFTSHWRCHCHRLVSNNDTGWWSPPSKSRQPRREVNKCLTRFFSRWWAEFCLCKMLHRDYRTTTRWNASDCRLSVVCWFFWVRYVVARILNWHKCRVATRWKREAFERKICVHIHVVKSIREFAAL